MAIKEGPDGFKEKAVKTKWPVDKGLTGGTQSQQGRVTNLVPRISLVSKRTTIGL